MLVKKVHQLAIEKELSEYKIDGISYSVGDYVRLDDIAASLINRVKNWTAGSIELSKLIEHNEYDFFSIYYSQETVVSEKTVIFYFENCSKLFSKSVFKISRMFLDSQNVYFQLENFLIVKLVEGQIQFYPHSKSFNQSEHYVHNNDIKRLANILNIYQNARLTNVLTEKDVENMITAEYYPLYLNVIEEKWK